MVTNVANRRYAVIVILILLVAGSIGAEETRVSEQVRSRINQDRPPNVAVTSIAAYGSHITLKGTSGNVNAIANFIENIKADPLFTAPEVKSVSERPGTSPKVYEYEFSFSVRSK